jgi:glycosyltransferase involved in cell wall biosynthesis
MTVPVSNTARLIAKFAAIQLAKIRNNKSEGGKRKYSFAYLSSEDPRNKRVWSGTLYAIYRQLTVCGEVQLLGPFKPTLRLIILRAANQLCLLFGKRLSYRHTRFLGKAYGKHFAKKLQGKKFDFIVAPAASGEISCLNTSIPIVYITDGTFAQCLNYHKSLSDLTQASIKEGNLIEALAIEKSAHVIVSSAWAAGSVRNDYKAPPEKVHIIPYGANFEQLPDVFVPLPVDKRMKLLFVGVYWHSKGGEIAWRAFRILRAKGLDVFLTIVGCEPPLDVKDENLEVIPFIDKNSPEGMNKLSSIYKEHHLLILPTRFDCTPIAINEASAFGMPSLVARTGGVEGHLKEGINGFLVDYSDTGEGYALRIEELIKQPEKLRELQLSSRKCYEDYLNWTTWTEKFIEIISGNS